MVLQVTLPLTACHLHAGVSAHLDDVCVLCEGQILMVLLPGPYDPTVFREVMQEHSQKFRH